MTQNQSAFFILHQYFPDAHEFPLTLTNFL
jgi:hypothetical protein